MRRLICTVVVRIWHIFSWFGSHLLDTLIDKTTQFNFKDDDGNFFTFSNISGLYGRAVVPVKQIWWECEDNSSHVRRLWYFSSAVNSFKRIYTAIQWGQISDSWSDPSFTFILQESEQRRLWRDCTIITWAGSFRDNFAYFSIKTYVVGAH